MKTKRTIIMYFAKLPYSLFAIHVNMESLKAELCISTSSRNLQSFWPIFYLYKMTNAQRLPWPETA